jgi:hypothetical protein
MKMDLEGFWKAISFIDDDALEDCDEETAVEPLVAFLSTKSVEDIGIFYEQLAQALFAIDGRDWNEHSGESKDSDDGFLYARCYVVAKGKEYYSNVLDNYSLMPKSSEQWAESLLYAASQAWAEVTGKEEEEFDLSTTVSFESVSNEALW